MGGALRSAAQLLIERYAAFGIVLMAWLAWKLPYYGDLLPNTNYAKAADQSGLRGVC